MADEILARKGKLHLISAEAPDDLWILMPRFLIAGQIKI